MPIVYCNKPFEELTGYTGEEVLGRNCRFLQMPLQHPETDTFAEGNQSPRSRPETPVPAQRPASLDILRKAVNNKQEVRVALKNYKKNGTVFINLLSVVPVYSVHDIRVVQYMIGFMAEARAE